MMRRARIPHPPCGSTRVCSRPSGALRLVSALALLTTLAVALTLASVPSSAQDPSLKMGTTPRTMGNVVNYINGKLQTAGVATKFAVSRTPGAAQTVQVGNSTLKLSPGPDSLRLLWFKENRVSPLHLPDETLVLAAPSGR